MARVHAQTLFDLYTTHPSGEHTSVYAEDNEKPTTWEPDHSSMELSQQTALPLYLQ